MSEEIVKQVLIDSDGQELDIKTPYVTRQVTFTKLMRIPLYVNGILKSAQELAKLGITLKEYTQQEVDQMTYTAWFQANPDLAVRVAQYKNYMDALNLPYSSTTDDIQAAISNDQTISTDQKLAMSLRIKLAFDNIVLNLQALDPQSSAFQAWTIMDKLIQYLPAGE